MGLLALELSDIGIMAAAEEPLGLLHVDGADQESPGCALAAENELLVGRAAESKARLFPLQFYNAFWDQLNTEPLKPPNDSVQNYAELAYAHLAQIWKNVNKQRDETVMAVPGYFDRDQLGLILGIAEGLSIPLKGMVALSVAAGSEPCPDRVLLHVDLHLHRAEVTFLEQGERLTQKDSVTLAGRGLHHLYTEWIKAIAEEFVGTTRFDPLHHAATEQELYSRLPGLMAALQQNPSVMFEMSAGPESYRVKLSRDLFVKQGEAVFQEIGRLIADMQERHGKPGEPMGLQLTHRVSRLPGCREMLSSMADAQVMELEPGCGAFGALKVWQENPVKETSRGVSFLTSRSWQARGPISLAELPEPQLITRRGRRPTHLLYRTLAYPLSKQPLVIGSGDTQEGVHVRIEGELAGVSRRHCSVQVRGQEVVLTDHSRYGTFVDDERVSGTAVLRLGQFIRVGIPGEKLQLIAFVEGDGT
jgi:hypothetical protein